MMTKKEQMDTVLMLKCSRQEVTRLAEVIDHQAAALRRAQQEAEKWERRLDKLLDKP